MNKVYTAWGLLFLIVLIGFAERITAESVSESMTETVMSINEAALVSSPDTEMMCRNAAESWDKSKPLLEVFFSHTDLVKTENALHSAEIFAKYDNYADASVMLATVCDEMKSLKDGERITYMNLL